jgi:hypothetical protein
MPFNVPLSNTEMSSGNGIDPLMLLLPLAGVMST